ncbi:hypothetical protein V6Z11_1Z029500 [Gossypium hirsutum]
MLKSISLISFRLTITKLTTTKMVSEAESMARESVIVVIDGKRSKGMVEPLDWALKHVVRRKNTKNATQCFPLNMRFNFSGILEKLEFSISSGHAEVKPRDLGEEIERKREQFQAILQPFSKQCKETSLRALLSSFTILNLSFFPKECIVYYDCTRDLSVKLEVKLAAGICPEEITLKEAENANTRWIVLDSHLKKYKMCIYWNVECNVAVMKGKDVATLMPSRAPKPDCSPVSSEQAGCETWPDDPSLNDQETGNQNVIEEGESSIQPAPRGPSEFLFSEIEEITNGFSDIVCQEGNLKVYEGVLQNTPVYSQIYSMTMNSFGRCLRSSPVYATAISMNIIGYCCTATNRLLISDYPCLYKQGGILPTEIGGSLRYLHEECPDGPIVHQSVCSSSMFILMLSNFMTAKWYKGDVPFNGNSTGKCPNLEEDKQLYVDIHDYGLFLVELISGKVAGCFPHENEGQSLIDWMADKEDDLKVVHVWLGRLCFVLAVVRGDQHA